MFCKRNKLFNELYDIQLWAKDYFRAAISSTLFYTKDAITYGQLLKREEHLVNAISHMKAFLDQAQGWYLLWCRTRSFQKLFRN